MSTATGHALAMRLKLRNLMQKHRVASESVTLPLFDPTPHEVVMCGYASTEDIDGDRCKFRPFAFGYPLKFKKYPPLYLKHDPSREVGKIDHLQYDELGNLQCWVIVTDPIAKNYPAFSIGAVVNEYSIVNADTPEFHAVVGSASLSEISLTDRPANKFAIVQDRYRTCPAVKTGELMIQKVKILQRMVGVLKELNHG